MTIKCLWLKKCEDIFHLSFNGLFEEGVELVYFSNDDACQFKVGIWYDGSMQISYPVQAGASKIEVQDH